MPQLGPPGLSQAVAPSPVTTFFPSVRTISIAGFVLPGKWTLVEAEKVFGWQIQQGYGLSGAFIFPKGDELVVAKFLGEFWASADFFQFRQLRSQLFKKPVFTVGGTISSAALGIDHPELKALGVTAVVVLKEHAAVHDGHGLWSVKVDFLQFRAPQPAPPIPKTKIPDVAAPQPTAQDNADLEIQKAQAQLTGLLGQ